MSSTITLPTSTGALEHIRVSEPADLVIPGRPSGARMAYAAGHVVADPLTSSIGAMGSVDWDATLEFRRYLWSLGLGVAESMDTAQRGMGLDAETALELASRTLKEAAVTGGKVLVGIATDQLTGTGHTLQQIKDAYIEQLDYIESLGGQVVMMASRQLAQTARSAEDYLDVYSSVLAQAKHPVVLHWLGQAFDQSLAGYWGSSAIPAAMDTVVTLITENKDKIHGIKLSLLDADEEIRLRGQLPEPVALFTGDDYNYVDLIAGDGDTHSHALLGAFAAVAPFAAASLARLDENDEAGYRAILEPTLPLSRLIFAAPTQFYKVGVVWLSYLTGRQNHFRMVGGLEAGRNLLHLTEIVRTANSIGLFPDPEATAARANRFFQVHGC